MFRSVRRFLFILSLATNTGHILGIITDTQPASIGGGKNTTRTQANSCVDIFVQTFSAALVQQQGAFCQVQPQHWQVAR